MKHQLFFLPKALPAHEVLAISRARCLNGGLSLNLRKNIMFTMSQGSGCQHIRTGSPEPGMLDNAGIFLQFWEGALWPLRLGKLAWQTPKLGNLL